MLFLFCLLKPKQFSPDTTVKNIKDNLEFYENTASAQVCKRWKLLSEDQSLWQKINLGRFRKVPAEFINKALRHGCQYLNLLGTKIESVQGPDSFSVKNQLKYLSISFYDGQKVLIENLIGATQLLEKLSIECYVGRRFNLQPNIIQNNKTLETI